MKLSGIAEQTLSIIERGECESASGKRVLIGPLVESARAGTLFYPPGSLDSVSGPSNGATAATLEVTTETTAEAGRRLAARGPVAALNFASAKNPGGGFLGGAKAQEEDLARCSALYPCLLTQPRYYAENRASGTMIYTDHLIWSPEVPFFRDERLELLDEPFLLSIVTAPAPNAGEALARDGGAGPEIRAALERRAALVLAAMVRNGARRIILGAWGCGVFRNEPKEVAEVFARLLESDRFARAFDEVVFAIYDRSREQRTLRAFEERLSTRGAAGAADRPA